MNKTKSASNVKSVNTDTKEYVGVITDLSFTPSSREKSDYFFDVSFAINYGGKIITGKMPYRNIFTNGREELQDLIDSFELIQKTKKGIEYLDFKQMTESYCMVELCGNKIIRLRAADDDYDDIDAETLELLNDVPTVDYDEKNVPHDVKYYRYIPSTYPSDEYLPGNEYHACIRNAEAVENGRAINVKISAYVFNGNKVKVIARFFNDIYGIGADRFTDFCRGFGLDNHNEEIDLDDFIGEYCKVVLYENSKGNKYIDTIEPLDDVSEEYDKQYKKLIRHTYNKPVID